MRNSQPHGIGRVVALDGLSAWSNLGRNVVFAGPDLRPRAVFDESVFTDDEASQYDLDVHAILDVPGQGSSSRSTTSAWFGPSTASSWPRSGLPAG